MTPIQTTYRGIRYRSRTEARWAVFFDELRVPYNYEPEGLELEGEWYLPDFWLPGPGLWFEVKGIEPNDRETRVARKLARLSRSPVLIAVGPPSLQSEFNIQAHDRDHWPSAVAFTGDADNLFITSECMNFCITVRGSLDALSGIPYPVTGAARVAATQRFGVHE